MTLRGGIGTCATEGMSIWIRHALIPQLDRRSEIESGFDWWLWKKGGLYDRPKLGVKVFLCGEKRSCALKWG